MRRAGEGGGSDGGDDWLETCDGGGGGGGASDACSLRWGVVAEAEAGEDDATVSGLVPASDMAFLCFLELDRYGWCECITFHGHGAASYADLKHERV